MHGANPGSTCRRLHHEKPPDELGMFRGEPHGYYLELFLPYLVTFADRLEGVGFRYVDGEVFAPKEEISEK